MSIRAYRVIKKELADECSFNLWHDEDLLDFFQENDGYHDYRNDEGGGEIEISTELLEKAVRDFKWEDEDYRLQAIKEDIKWAEENEKEWVIYECF